jgi:hypothetical protein
MSSLLSTPILAMLDGSWVFVYGTAPDGRILIARPDGHTDVTTWTRLVVPAESPPAADDEARDLLDESIELCRILGVSTAGDYDLLEAARAVVAERDRLRALPLDASS